MSFSPSRAVALACCSLFLACGPAGGDPADAGGDPVDAGGTPDAGGADAGSPPLGMPGAACESDDDCAGNADALCIRTVKGGYCAIVGCTVSTNRGCPANALCVAIDEETNACLEGPCDGDSANCARRSEGFTCLDDLNVCWNYDYAPQNPGEEPIGSACTDDSDCESGSCFPEEYEDGSPTGFIGGSCTYFCNADAAVPCPSGSTCVAGLCLDDCGEGATCREGYVCSGGVCQRDIGDVPLGNACEDYTDCGWGDCAPEIDPDLYARLTGYPGGYCTVWDLCEVGTSGACGANGTCVETWYEGTICAKSCTNDEGCREGYACVEGACLRPPSDVANVRLGAACAVDADCDVVEGAHGFCVIDDDPEFPYFTGGYCMGYGCTTANATTGATDSCAPHGGTCFGLSEYSVGRYCLKSCENAAECRTDAGYTCDGDDTCWPE